MPLWETADWPLPLWLTLATLLGLVIGSFLNVVIYRLPLMLRREWGEEHLPELTLSWPGSHCPSCQAPVRWWQNLPLISWLLLRGRCASCATPISRLYPLVELTAALLSLLLAWRYGMNLQTLALMGFAWTLLALAVIDTQTRLLPDRLTLPLLWTGLTWHWLFSSEALFNQAFLGAIIGYLSLWSLYWLFKLLTGREGMGYGDFKLLAALGAWLGAPALLPVILLSSVSGLLVALVLKLRAEWQGQALPFGPHLVIAALLLLVGGRELTSLAFLDDWLLITNWAFILP
ncbi:prepilin peptidase [Marinospirillum alkaliphilum]|uniref:Prepilin leader peptidase/N-methyltransferase n=1 Tax=Marinospirillum alkaliphilum DSM 21637 TaxID=1122209 RepID=A0A1K1TUA7_9GAMM|nr:A24 family peptidase [Marinospirillum alkaliphilum]SFX04150.1 leader peptidase (prepilin peptidase) / N-methyltransferase [Marinospirillum alkaliphilum DSM 21637]